MIFTEAYKFMQQGYSIRREGWDAPDEKDWRLHINQENGIVYCGQDNCEEADEDKVFHIWIEDAIATDWETVECEVVKRR